MKTDTHIPNLSTIPPRLQAPNAPWPRILLGIDQHAADLRIVRQLDGAGPIRMKEGTQQSQKYTANRGGGVFAWGGKARGKVQMATKHPQCQRKTGADWKKD